MESSETDRLLDLAAAGDQASWRKLLDYHGKRISRMVALRIDARIAGRIDVDDVLQETFLEAWRALPRYLSNREVPFYLWLRGVAGNKLLDLHRRHLGVQKRDVRREVAMHRNHGPETTSDALAGQLVGNMTPPSRAAERAEMTVRLRTSLDNMDAMDREVLALRHFEQLTTAETAQILGIESKAAGMRYIRALRRLRVVLGALPGGLSDV